MTSAKKLGQQRELLWMHELEKAGHEIFFRTYTVRRGPLYVGLDFAHLFDIVSVKIIDGKPYWYFYSVKSAGTYRRNAHIHELKTWKKTYAFAEASVILVEYVKAGWHGRGKNRKYRKGYFRVFDI